MSTKTTNFKKLFGRYQVLGKIGQGAMGSIFKARDLQLDRIVAIKTIPSNLLNNEEAHLRFQREAKSHAALNHPNIVNIYDLGQNDKIAFIAMEYLSHGSLSSVIGRNRLSLLQKCQLLMKILNGLEHAHKKRNYTSRY